MLEKWQGPNGQHSRTGNSTTEGFETANANQGLDQGHISPLFLHSTIWPYIRAEMHRPQLATNCGPDRPGNGAQLYTYQRWAQLSRVPHFEILRFRWVAHVSVRGKTSCAKTRCWDWLGPSRKDGLRRRTTTNLSVIVISQIFAIGAYWDYVSSNISHTNESQRGSLLSGLRVR